MITGNVKRLRFSIVFYYFVKKKNNTMIIFSLSQFRDDSESRVGVDKT